MRFEAVSSFFQASGDESRIGLVVVVDLICLRAHSQSKAMKVAAAGCLLRVVVARTISRPAATGCRAKDGPHFTLAKAASKSAAL